MGTDVGSCNKNATPSTMSTGLNQSSARNKSKSTTRGGTSQREDAHIPINLLSRLSQG
jgi:hypothetical protein